MDKAWTKLGDLGFSIILNIRHIMTPQAINRREDRVAEGLHIQYTN